MNRWEFLKNSIAVGIGVGCLSGTANPQASPPVQQDRFGGWNGKTFKATGFFRLEKGEKRWWLISPEGNAFLIHGIDHVDAPKIARSYNKEHWDCVLGFSSKTSPQERLHTFYNQKIAKDRQYRVCRPR